MYARYIPPAKEPSRSKPTSDPVAFSPSAVAVPPPSSATPYARYIPPPKPKAEPSTLKRKIVFDYEDVPVAEATSKKRSKRDQTELAKTDGDLINSPDEASGSVTPGSSRKSEEAIARGENSTNLSTEPSKHATSLQESPAENGSTAALRSKSKTKDKKSKASTGNTVHGEEVRYKAVLAKKEKSLTRTRNLDEAATHSAVEGADSALDSTLVAEPVEAKGLEPLPQPEPIPIDRSKPSYETLPPWLAEPIRVSPETRAPFSSLGVDPEHGIPPLVEKALREKGWTDAFAVQTAVIPLLLPACGRQGDLVISAATGSGKTLAYVLPMMRDLSRALTTKLRGLIVVPTRELVQQAKEVCEACATAFATSNRRRVKVGVAMGSQSLEKEQSSIMEEYQRYDPLGYQRYCEARARWPFGDDSSLAKDVTRHSTRPLPEHVVEHIPKVDVLVCTPGRLVEHIKSTPGFSLDFVRWLVIDEADKLLGQSFQQWLDVVMEKLGDPKHTALREFADSNKKGVRKVVLSATMTKDLSLLNGLRLSRPKHIVLEGTKTEEAGDFVLPDLLEEFGLKIREESQKPLYLVELLNSKYLGGTGNVQARRSRAAEEDSETSSDESDSETSSTSLESDSGSETSSASSSLESEEDSDEELETPSETKSRSSGRIELSTTVLVFTKSNESALRLSRLIGILAPQFSPIVGTLTSTIRTSERRKILRSFAANKLRILIASDIASRGLDLPHLDHVVNYDMPTSVASYVHRVGRTARAGRSGKAWTLFTKKEAGWFWPEVAGQGKKGRGSGGTVKRSNKVEQIVLGGGGDGDGKSGSGGRFSEERIEEYEAALEKLGQEAAEGRRKGKMAATSS